MIWTERTGQQGQQCWDTEGIELADIPGCSPVLGSFDTLDEAKAEAEKFQLAAAKWQERRLQRRTGQ